MNRRTMIRSLGALGAVSLLGGCGQFGGETTDVGNRPATENPRRGTRDVRSNATAGPPPEPRQTDVSPFDHYGQIVNVAAAGADPEGRAPINAIVGERVDDDTLLYFPPGTYLVDGTVSLLEFEKLGILGDGATIVPPDGYENTLFDIGRSGRAHDVFVDGLTFDLTASDTGGRIMSVLADGPIDIRNVTVVGTLDAGDGGMMRVDVTDPDGQGVVRSLRFPDGSTPGTKASGCYVGEEHRGAIQFVDCLIDGFADNGLYADPQEGTVTVRGGYFANCNVSSLRVGDGGTVKGARVRCDRSPSQFGNMRGIRLRHGRDILVEDCIVELLEVTGSDGGIVMSSDLEGATIKNTSVRINTDNVNAIRAKSPDSGFSSPEIIRCEDVHVTGLAAGGAVVTVDHRTGCEFSGMTIQQSGADRDGFHFEETVDATIRNSIIDVTGRPVVTSGESTVRRDGVEIR